MNFPVDLHEAHLKLAAELSINPEDIEEHHTRGHGHGGQKINKSSNCVELTHNPTGVIVRYQHHRGLHQNREEAYELLIEKIDEHIRREDSLRAQANFKIHKQKQRRSRKSKEKMLEEKHQKSEIKKIRKKII
ncbi:peptide chain release factor-like protein [Patescibacteria group bacterium]|nr:peptide chain release factor-like protein [Patescibacteria group bacterium]